MIKLGRPSKNPAEVKVTASYCLSKQNKKKIEDGAKRLKISASEYLNKLLENMRQ